MSSGRDSKSNSLTSDDAMRVVLTEGQTHILPDASGIKRIANIRAALSSYQALKPNSLAAPTKNTAGKMPAAPDDKEIAQAVDNPDMELTTSSATQLKKSSSVILSVPTWWVKFYDIPGIDELPKVLQYLCLAYADYLPEEKVIYQYPNSITISSAPFFTRYISQIQYRLEQAANDFLREGNIDKALALIEQNDKVINIETQGTDRFGRCIKGRTLLQMAAMAGDVNLRKKKAEEKKDHGAVELFAQAAKLTKDEVATQLFPVLFSNEAKNANEARAQRVLAVVQEFGESIIKRKTELPESWNTIEEFKAAQAKCQPEIDKLRSGLIQIISNEVISFGYILDTHIYDAFGEWFSDIVERLGDWGSLSSDLVWLNGYGSLQYVASAGDAHIHRLGIGSVVESGVVPIRTLKNSGGSTYFDHLSRLGLDFYLGYYGEETCGMMGCLEINRCWKTCVEQKHQRCKTYATSQPTIESRLFNSVDGSSPVAIAADESSQRTLFNWLTNSS